MEQEKSLQEIAGALLTQSRCTLATAESCTGGLIGHLLTSVPGSSAYYLGGVITYSNEAKNLILGVSQESLISFGAVSEQVAEEMALGAKEVLNSDLAISATGIAGPDGGTAIKPVGLTFISLAYSGGVRTEKHIWKGTRAENKLSSAHAALSMIITYLSNG